MSTDDEHPDMNVRIYGWKQCLTCGNTWPGIGSRCAKCGSRLVKPLGTDDVKCLMENASALEKRVALLEKEHAPPKKPVKLIRTKPKLQFVIRHHTGDEGDEVCHSRRKRNRHRKKKTTPKSSTWMTP